jgi:hypothetical protein
MGLLEKEILELRNLRRDYRTKKIDERQVNTEIAIYSQIEKRAKLLLQAYTSGAKVKQGLTRELVKSNLIGEGEAIDIGEENAENDKVRCYEKDAIITRQECLDYSGSHPDCVDCEIGIATKRKLLPEQF